MERDKSPKRQVKKESEFEGNWSFDWLQSYGMLALGLPAHVYFRIYDACIMEFYKKTHSFHDLVRELILHTGWRKLCCEDDDNCYEATYFEWEIDVFRKGKREIACGLDCQGKREFWFQANNRYYDIRGLSYFTKTKEEEKWSRKKDISEEDFTNEILKEILGYRPVESPVESPFAVLKVE